MGLEIGKTYFIKNVASGKYLNIYGTDTVSNSRNVNVCAKEDCKAQKWIVRLSGNGARALTTINEAYALNIYVESGSNCTMYSVAQNTENDYVVDFLTVDASQNLYKIKMMAHNKYLCVYDLASGNAFWSTNLFDPYTLWQLEDASVPVIPPSSSSILDRNTTPPTETGLVTVYDIPDVLVGGVEASCEMHKGSMIPDGTNFSGSSKVVIDIKNAINTLIAKVYPAGTYISDPNKYYYLFGEKRYNSSTSVCHNGVDILGPDQAEIKALFSGTVTKSGGSVFSIYSPNLGVTYNYVHLSGHRYAVGQAVSAGSVIGNQSDVGDAAGSHLHFEVTAGNKTAQLDTASVNTHMLSIVPYGYMLG